MTGVNDSASPLSGTYSGLVLTGPTSRGLNADAYVRLTGSVTNADPAQAYAWVRVTYNDDPGLQRFYWFNQEFDVKVWLRVGEGTYTIEVLKGTVTADRGGDRFILWWTYYRPAA